MLESDEDELDDAGEDYLEKLEEKVNKATASAPFAISASLQVCVCIPRLHLEYPPGQPCLAAEQLPQLFFHWVNLCIL